MNDMTQEDRRFRLGPLARKLMEAEADDETRPTADHLELAIARLEGMAAANLGVLPVIKMINENIMRLCSILIAEIMVEEGEVLEAMKELRASISRDIGEVTKDTLLESPDLSVLREELDRQVAAHRDRPTKEKSTEIGDRER